MSDAGSVVSMGADSDRFAFEAARRDAWNASVYMTASSPPKMTYMAVINAKPSNAVL